MAHGHVPRRSLIVIVGSTGTGKSQLAVELASRFNGEIINGDAMQLYDGLPIITNKITTEEQKGIHHHLLGCIDLNEPTWTVGTFVQKACTVIEEIRSRGKLPILVGGTHYYTQSLLLGTSLADQARGPEESNDSNQQCDFPILEEPTDVILAKLREVDPVMADRWHPNDRRKIRRSLEIWLKTGKTASQTYEEQRSARENGAVQEPSLLETSGLEDDVTQMRYPTLILWAHAEKAALNSRLDARVDTMIKNGLLDEVKSLDDIFLTKQAAGETIDRTRGIWVSIGYKEFESYQKALRFNDVSEEELAKLQRTAIEQTQAATRRYAKSQIRWIRIKLIHALRAANAADYFYLLDGTDLQAWDTSVLDPAVSLTESFLNGADLPPPASLSTLAADLLSPRQGFDLGQRRDLWQRKTCETCNTVAVTELDWEKHVGSNGHKKAVAAGKKRALQGEMIEILKAKAQAGGGDVNG
ncbi:tRNA isopentenyltransferase [Aulographum hederae CBS 113979]|uniref:tRNA dimethylallyltransferase n=1 Tax=Aulographum hederae CBS 113979 TaxID=1176131 RepID=A0A6G1GQX9_9PEZI|nr:tRNA isopentenyltransferase [Aulographum hederae CBS 113979]